MIKHIGVHTSSNNRKVVLLFREVPDEPHMCLVTYPETLPRAYHDEIMRVLETPHGQESKSFSDVLFRTVMKDGSNCLETLHRNGFIHKVACNQIKVTPNSQSSIMLDELNRILNEMEKGEQAQKELADIKENRTSKKTSADKPREIKTTSSDINGADSLAATGNGILTDRDLAQQRIQQAERMRADANRLLTEAEILIKEAADLDPTLKNDTAKKKTTKAKKDQHIK